MTNSYSMDDLLDFLSHAGKKGMMPAATSRALAVAARNVFGVLDAEEQENISGLGLETVIKRFNNKRAKDFNPGSLKAYGQRVQRAVELYEQWMDNPADFSVKTRNSGTSRKPIKTKQTENRNEDIPMTTAVTTMNPIPPNRQGTYQSSFPVGPGRVITVSSIPEDLTSLEAEKLAQFVRMLAVE
ncbi:MAG: hypothetical protein ABL999_09580 [Pyrinomonadaceae bacterium]